MIFEEYRIFLSEHLKIPAKTPLLSILFICLDFVDK